MNNKTKGCLILLSLMFLSITSLVNSQQDEREYPNPAACVRGGDINALGGVPRVNRKLQPVPKNLGNMNPVVTLCSDNSESICQTEDFSGVSMEALQSGSYNDDPKNWLNYIDVVSVWAIVGIFFAVATIVGGCVFCCCRCCCKKCGGGKPVLDDDGKALYPFWQIAATYGTLVLFLIFMTAFALAGVVQGNLALTKAQKSFVRAPEATVSFAKGLFVPVDNLVPALMGKSFVGFVKRFNTFANETVSYNDVDTIFTCVENAVDVVTNDSLFRFFLDTLDNFTVSADNLPIGNTTSALLAQFDNFTQSLDPPVENLKFLLGNLNQTVNDINITQLETDIDNLNSSLSAMKTEINDVKDKLVLYQTLETTANTAKNDISSLIAGHRSSGSAFTSTKASVLSFNNANTAAPPVSALVADLVSLNTSVNLAEGNLTQLISSLEQIQLQLNSTLNNTFITQLNATFINITEILDSVNLTDITSTVFNVSAFFDVIPPLGPIIAQVDLFKGAGDQLPCILNVSIIVARIQNAIYEIPQDLVVQLNDTIDLLNSSIADADTQIAEFKNFMLDLNQTLEDGKPNTTEIEDFTTQINQSISDIRATIVDLQVQLGVINDSLSTGGQYNIQPLINQAKDALNTLRTSPAHVDDATIANIEKLDDDPSFVSGLNALVSKLNNAAYNAAVVDVNNNVDVQCSPGAPTVCYAATGQPSFVSGNCPFSCPLAVDEYAIMETTLGAFVTNISAIGISSKITGLDAATTSIDAVDFTNFNDFTQITDLQNEVGNYTTQVDELDQSLQDIFTQNLSSLTDVFNSSQEIITNLKNDINSYRDIVLNLNETAQNQASVIRNLLEKKDDLFQLLEVDLNPLLDTINENQLSNEIQNGNGLFGAGEKILDFAKNLVSRIPDGLIGNIDPDALIGDYLDVLKVADIVADRDDKLAKAGAIHYAVTLATKIPDTLQSSAFGRRLMHHSGLRRALSDYISTLPKEESSTFLFLHHYNERVLQGSNNSPQPGGGSSSSSPFGSINPLSVEELEAGNYEFPTVFGDFKNNKIEKYPEEKVCFTNACLDNTVDLYNTKPVPELEQALGQSVPVSREQAMLLPFIAPLFVILIGILTICFPRCGPCLSCCTICTSFFFFLFIGTLFFPLTIGLSDTCGSAEYIGATAASSVEPYVCSMIPTANGLNSFDAVKGYCVAEIETPFATLNLDIDVDQLLLSLLRDCEGLSTANSANGSAIEPVAALWARISAQIPDVVEEQINKVLDDNTNGISIREQAMAVIRSIIPDASDDAGGFTDDLAGAISCESVSSVYLGYKDTMCCDLFGSVYWWAASFYLMAFTMLFCGCPAGALAHTRLHGHKIQQVAQVAGRETIVRAKRVKDKIRGSFTAGPIAVAVPIEHDDAHTHHHAMIKPFNPEEEAYSSKARAPSHSSNQDPMANHGRPISYSSHGTADGLKYRVEPIN